MFEISVVNRRVDGENYEVKINTETADMGDEVERRLRAIAKDRLKKGIPVAVLKNGVVRAHGEEAELLIYKIAGTVNERTGEGTITVEIDPVLSRVREIRNTAHSTAQAIPNLLRSPGGSIKWTVVSAVRGRAR